MLPCRCCSLKMRLFYCRVQCKTPVGQYGSKVDIVISVNDSHWDEVKKYDIMDKRTIDGGFEYEVGNLFGSPVIDLLSYAFPTRLKWRHGLL